MPAPRPTEPAPAPEQQPAPARHHGMDAACFTPAALLTLALAAVAVHRAPWDVVGLLCAVPLGASVAGFVTGRSPVSFWRLQAAVSVVAFLVVSRYLPTLLPWRWGAHQAAGAGVVTLLVLVAAARYPDAHRAERAHARRQPVPARDRHGRTIPAATGETIWDKPKPARPPQPVPAAAPGPVLDRNKELWPEKFEEIAEQLADVDERAGEYAQSKAQELVLSYLQNSSQRGRTIRVTGAVTLLEQRKIKVDPTTVRRWFRNWEAAGLAECVHGTEWRSKPPKGAGSAAA